MRVALYARVSTNDQHPENQLLDLRRYARERGWDVQGEYVDKGISGSRDRTCGQVRPAECIPPSSASTMVGAAANVTDDAASSSRKPMFVTRLPLRSTRM